MKQSTTTITTATLLESIRSTYESISLRRFCEETGLCYQYVLKASKRPVSGVAYDAAAFNYEAVAAIVDRKGIDLSLVDWEAVASSVKPTAPVNKPEDFQVGTRFTLRESKVREIVPVYTVVFITDTHVVFLPDEDTQPRCMNWDTFSHQSPRITADENADEVDA